MASYIAIFLCLVCIILLSILLIKFRKLFSTDAIIEKTRTQMNKMIADINKNATRDMDLINDCSKRVRALLSESEQKMEQYRQATERLREMIAFAEKLESSGSRQKTFAENPYISNIKPVGQIKKDFSEKDNFSKIDPDASYKVNVQQSSLFDDIDNSSKAIISDEIKITPDGAAYKELPIVNSKYYEEKPINRQNLVDNMQISEKIRILLNQGLEIEEIVKKLSCSISEVQFIIDTM